MKARIKEILSDQVGRIKQIVNYAWHTDKVVCIVGVLVVVALVIH